MGLRKLFIVAACIVFSACAYAGVKYYGLSEVDYSKGKLLGPRPKDDLPFTVCAPAENNTFPCVVLFEKDFFQLKRDYEDTKQKLKACEKSKSLQTQ